MKLIKAYIRKRKTEDVYEALKKEGLDSMTMIECEGTGKYTDREREHISEKYTFVEAYMVVKLEILLPDSDLKKAIRIIRENGSTGYSGDGIIIVSPVDEVHKIRNEQEGIESV
jgi:nitrogen regulatory protein P-II 1